MSYELCPACGYPLQSRKPVPELCFFCDSRARVVCEECGAGLCRDHAIKLGEYRSWTEEVGDFGTKYHFQNDIGQIFYVCDSCRTVITHKKYRKFKKM